MNAKTTILLLPQTHRYVCDDSKSKWQHPANTQRLAESNTDTGLAIPMQTCTLAQDCTQTHCLSRHRTTSLSSCQRRSSQHSSPPPAYSILPWLHFSRPHYLSSKWLKPERVVILFQTRFWKSKATSCFLIYTNCSFKPRTRVCGNLSFKYFTH